VPSLVGDELRAANENRLTRMKVKDSAEVKRSAFMCGSLSTYIFVQDGKDSHGGHRSATGDCIDHFRIAQDRTIDFSDSMPSGWGNQE
jgi:hypothetical protein